MKIINFSIKEILSSLLNKSKTQTIRPAWKVIDIQQCRGTKKIMNTLSKEEIDFTEKYVGVKLSKVQKELLGEKPPRFKVGEKVKLLWNQRSKYEWFDRISGKGLTKEYCKAFLLKQSKSRNKSLVELEDYFNNSIWNAFFFNKHLGTAEITEVFKIEMRIYRNHLFLQGIKMSLMDDLAKRDGFRDKDSTVSLPYPEGGDTIYKKPNKVSAAEQMFKILDKMYDLSSPKEFYVYRWKWFM